MARPPDAEGPGPGGGPPRSRAAGRPRGAGRLRRRLAATGLRARLVLSHVAVLVIALAVMSVAARLRAPRGFERAMWGYEGAHARNVSYSVLDVLGDSLLLAMAVGLAAAVLLALALSKVLLSPLDRIRAAARRLAAGKYGELLDVPGEPGLAVLVRDVNHLAAALADTERRRARLVSEVAHEMRTPLATLRGQIDGIADGVFAPDEPMLASLSEDLDRLHRLAEDLSQLSRIEEGGFALRRERADVCEVVRRTVERLRPRFADAGVALLAPSRIPAFAHIDPDRVAQVVTNLLGNALVASGPGGLVTAEVLAGRDEVLISVEDDGVGLDAEDLERIFARFERIDHPRRGAPASGSGIGLTIARGIANGHGGDITASSPGPGRGARFDVRLPRRRPQAPDG
ncbi:sensor histidine kinase [Streptomyces sp. NPDC050560]|uniref:sensor histidine kinase n=1 Tax=Streptomyces sp. NPDC050560 TaxID=3365630 RepID=UPI0037A76BA0